MRLKVGDRVKLSEWGLEFYHLREQSKGGEGEVIVTRPPGLYYKSPYRVRWDHGGDYTYYTGELEPVGGINEEELYY